MRLAIPAIAPSGLIREVAIRRIDTPEGPGVAIHLTADQLASLTPADRERLDYQIEEILK